jgi:hypothetical protein
MDIEAQLAAFVSSLSEFEPKAVVDFQVAEIFNALLEAAKGEAGDNPIVAAIQPARKTSTGNSALTAGELRTAASQLLAAV